MSFSRKDHYRDHLKEYHKEDLGCAKKSKTGRQKSQESWLRERNISEKWWRCAKCLTRVYIKDDGWRCPTKSCSQPCEPERRKARELLSPGLLQEDVHLYEFYSACAECKWSESGQWVPCSSCGLLAESSRVSEYAASMGYGAYPIV